MSGEPLLLGGGAGELAVTLARLGGRLVSVGVPTADGGRREVLAGIADDAAYLASGDHQGGSVGRYANRVARGELPVDGVVHRLATNDDEHTLHGGPEGFDRRRWSVVEHGSHHAVLALESPDGDQGFPGTVRVRVRFEVSGTGLATSYDATTDTPTHVSLTSHPYFRLADQVTDHVVRVPADHYLPTDASGLPLGVAPVAGTAYDLRAGVPVDPALDHCFLVDGKGMRPVAELSGGGLVLRMSADQPGLQVYGGAGLVEGVALEPQHLPDSPHHPDWPSTLLRPGERLAWRSVVTVDRSGVHASP